MSSFYPKNCDKIAPGFSAAIPAYKSKCFFVINFVLRKAESITLLDLTTKAKLSICLILCRPIGLLHLFSCLTGDSVEGATFPGPHCKSANISIEGLVWMATLVSSVLMISVKPEILYELNQYRKANNV